MAAKSAPNIWAPVVVPFDGRLAIDMPKLVHHCKWIATRRCGLAIFGTNSEATSLSTAEKIEVIDTLLAEGLLPRDMLPGVGGCALPDVVELTTLLNRRGVHNVLMLPPFYYKGVSDEGLFAFYAEVIERVGDQGLRIFLYHIPAITGVALSPALIERLMSRYPTAIAGIKDSGGDPDHTRMLIELFPGWTVYPGNETYLAKAARWGAAGCISATCNIDPAGIVHLFDSALLPQADQLQHNSNILRGIVSHYPMIAALKAVIGISARDEDWRLVRPPLVALTEVEVDHLRCQLDAIEFSLPLYDIVQQAGA